MYGRFPQQINQLQNAAMMAHQQRLAKMQGGLGGLGGGLSDQVFEPLKNMLGQHLTQSVVQEKVEPFVEEVKQMAQERFDLGGGPQLQMTQAQPAVMPTRMPFKNAFGGFADGGPVAKGLGSFLTSNIDEFGRNGDTEVIHATKSEVVLPKGMVDNPQVAQTVRDLFEQTGRDMQEYTVGSGQMNVNPMTGYEEAFDLIGGIKDIFKKAAPVLLPIATTFLFPGMSPFLSGALAGGVGSLIQGGSIEDAFKSGIQGGLTSAAAATLFSGGNLQAGFEKVDPSLDRFEMRKDPLGDLGLGGKAAANESLTNAARPDRVMAASAEQPGFLNRAASATKDFFYSDPQTAQQISGLTPEAFANLGDASKAELFKQAGASGGVNLGRTIAGGLGALALAGGFDEEKADDLEDPYPYSSRELIEMYPESYLTGPYIAPRRKTFKDKIEFGTQFKAKGGEMEFPRRQGYIAGPGTETSDDIPAMLSDGEFVMTARAVRGAGDGSRKDGVKKMYDIMRAFEGGVVS